MPRTNSFSITEIAAWALPAASDSPTSDLRVELPALQRGAVWPPHQVERLWDSLVRGFPIGCFILSEPQPHLGARNSGPREEQMKLPQLLLEGHLLLDGQQRSTAIATGFLDPWRNPAPCQCGIRTLDRSRASAALRTVRSCLPLAHPITSMGLSTCKSGRAAKYQCKAPSDAGVRAVRYRYWPRSG